MKKKHRFTESTGKKDKSILVPQREKVTFDLNIRERDDLTEKQKVIIETMLDKQTKCVFIDGYWGTSKSFLSVLSSLKLLNNKKIDGILYVRNLVEASRLGEVGVLPGSLEERTAPYNAILYEKLDEMLPKEQVKALIKDGRIECVPLSFVRGRSWNCKAIIVDEAASMSFDDLLLILSRCGPYTKIFVIGDSANQNDIGNQSGFRKMFETFDDLESKENGVFAFELRDSKDIIRSGFVRFLMEKTGIIKRF